jgi:hypothetical protein
MPRIILHIGTHKTGTTGLQLSLFDQREKLKQFGICYDPWPGVLWGLKYAHHGLAHRLARYSPEDQQILADYRLRIEQALGAGEDVIISAEPFYRQVVSGMSDDLDAARALFLDRAAGYFEGLPIEVSVCFRRPDRMAESLFKEHAVSTDNKLGFVAWLEKWASRFEYAARVAEFEQRFGPAKIWCFEDAVTEGLASAFLRVHGFSVADLSNPKADRQGVSARAVEWLLLSKQSDDMSVSERHIRWYYVASSHAHPVLYEGPRETCWTNLEARNEFFRTALTGFRYVDFWNQPDSAVEKVQWTEDLQREVEAHFEKWAQRSSVLMKMRKAAKLAPYDADDRIPPSIRLKYFPQRIRELFRGTKKHCWK